MKMGICISPAAGGQANESLRLWNMLFWVMEWLNVWRRPIASQDQNVDCYIYFQEDMKHTFSTETSRVRMKKGFSATNSTSRASNNTFSQQPFGSNYRKSRFLPLQLFCLVFKSYIIESMGVSLKYETNAFTFKLALLSWPSNVLILPTHFSSLLNTTVLQGRGWARGIRHTVPLHGTRQHNGQVSHQVGQVGRIFGQVGS